MSILLSTFTTFRAIFTGPYAARFLVNKNGVVGAYPVFLYESDFGKFVEKQWSNSSGVVTFSNLENRAYHAVATDPSDLASNAGAAHPANLFLMDDGPPTGWTLSDVVTIGLARKTLPAGVEMGDPSVISGTVTLDSVPVQATLYLIDPAGAPSTTSDPVTGAYAFDDPGDGSVIPQGVEPLILCDYGEGIRPLAHRPVTAT